MSIKIVIAKYKEDISWSDKFKNERIVYEKFYDSNNKEFIRLENKGREAGTYLQFIVDNYDNLPDVTIFTQGDPGILSNEKHGSGMGITSCEHPSDPELKKIFNFNGKFNNVDVFSKIVENSNVVKEMGYLGITEKSPILKWDTSLNTPFPKEASHFDKFNGYGLMNCCFLRHPFDGIWAVLDLRVVYSYLFNDKIDEYYWNEGAIFAVHKDRILFHNKEFYEKALDITLNPSKFGLSDDNYLGRPIRRQEYKGYENSNTKQSMRIQSNIPHSFERLWKIIFDGKTN